MDVRTMAVMVGTVSVLLAVVLFAQYRFNRSYPGLGWWAAGQAAVAAGFIVSAMRGDSLVGHIAVPAYQALIVAGVTLIYIGILRFLGHRERWTWISTGWLVFLAWTVFFTFAHDDPTIRSMGLYVSVAVVLGLGAYALRQYRLSTVGGSATFVSVVFAVGSLGYLVLAVAEPLRTKTDNVFYAPSPVNAGAFLIATITTILWTFGLVIMINQRLAGEIAVDARNMHSVFATSPDSAIISRLADGRIEDVNEGFTVLTGYTRDEVVGEGAVAVGLWVDVQRRAELLRELSSSGTVTDFAFEVRRKDGTTVQCLLAASTLTLNDEPYLITVARDVTQQRRMEAQLLHEATTDSLTGLPNRRHFLSVCERELRRSERSGSPLSVAVIDIDHFKDINDSHGHAAGDAAVTAIGAAVTARIRDIDTLGRLGGDEFGLLLPDSGLDAACAAVERVRAALADARILVEDYELAVTLSAGVATVVAGDSVDVLLVRADRALYDAKETGRNRVVAARTQ